MSGKRKVIVAAAIAGLGFISFKRLKPKLDEVMDMADAILQWLNDGSGI